MCEKRAINRLKQSITTYDIARHHHLVVVVAQVEIHHVRFPVAQNMALMLLLLASMSNTERRAEICIPSSSSLAHAREFSTFTYLNELALLFFLYNSVMVLSRIRLSEFYAGAGGHNRRENLHGARWGGLNLLSFFLLKIFCHCF